jgi:hypothetical protein
VENTDKASKETAAIGEQSEEDSTKKCTKLNAETKDVESEASLKNVTRTGKEQTTTACWSSSPLLLPPKWWQPARVELYEEEVGGEDLGVVSKAAAMGSLSSSMSYRRCGLRLNH